MSVAFIIASMEAHLAAVASFRAVQNTLDEAMARLTETAADVPLLLAAVGAVLDRHYAKHDGDRTYWCATDGKKWPCDDFVAVSKGLGA